MSENEMEINEDDYYNDSDLAAPEALPEGKRFIGVVTVDASRAEMGNYRAVEGSLKDVLAKRGDYRDGIPQVTLTLITVGFAGQPKGFPEDRNYLKQVKADFWVGKVDKIGRNQLSKLTIDATGKTEEEIKSMPIRESAKLLDKAYLTYEVKQTTGKQGGTFANPVKFKAATAEEVALVL